MSAAKFEQILQFFDETVPDSADSCPALPQIGKLRPTLADCRLKLAQFRRPMGGGIIPNMFLGVTFGQFWCNFGAAVSEAGAAGSNFVTASTALPVRVRRDDTLRHMPTSSGMRPRGREQHRSRWTAVMPGENYIITSTRSAVSGAKAERARIVRTPHAT